MLQSLPTLGTEFLMLPHTVVNQKHITVKAKLLALTLNQQIFNPFLTHATNP